MKINKLAMNLYRRQDELGLSNQDIADILNEEEGVEYSESKWRKMYKYGVKFYDAGRKSKIEEFDKSVLIINDLHLPFERSDVFDVIEKHQEEITHVVIGGDLMDCKSISFFSGIRKLTLLEEMKYTHEWLSALRDKLDDNQQIIIINGNHEERWYTEIKNLKQENMQQLLDPHILNMIINGYTVYDDEHGDVEFEPIKGITYIPRWFVNINDKLIIAHPKNFSQVDGRMCESVVAHFNNRGEEYDAVVFGHTHKYSQMKVSRRGGKFAVENGCMCKPQDYADIGKLSFTPQDYAYTLVKWNDDENIDYNNIRVYHLDEEVDNSSKLNI